MSTTPAMIVIPLSICIAGFAILFYGRWQDQRIGVARVRLFGARDELFILFAKSDLGVDHPCHRELRRIFNRMIRYAHRVTWFRVMLYIRFAPRMERASEVSNAVDRLQGHECYDNIRKCVAESNDAIFCLMVERSILLIILCGAFVTVNRLNQKWKQLRGKYMEPAADTIFAAAEQEEMATGKRRKAEAAA